MSGDQQDVDRNEPATAYKLDKAHERGSVPRSADVTFLAVFVVEIGYLYGNGEATVRRLARLIPQSFSHLASDGFHGGLALELLGRLAVTAITVVSSLLFVIWLSAFLAAALQARGVFTAEQLKPDVSRLNPAAGFKKLISVKTPYELLRSSLKLSALTGMASLWGWLHLPELLSLSAQSSNALLRSTIALLGSALLACLSAVAVLALFDWMFHRWEFARQMRMSKRELKQEHKDREGDPRIKQRLHELRLEWLKRTRALANVRTADVLVTNPTHYAVALEYRHGVMPAPILTIKGAGELAHRMRREAHRRGVPIVENPPLARALFASTPDGAYVPDEHFVQIARILRWVYAGRKTRPVGTAVS